MHVHLIGIGGTGLSAIAKVLLERGFTVTGSDRVYSDLVKAVESVGAQVFIGHNSKNITGADFIVRSSAVPDDNVEVLAAKKAGIPVHKRADFLHNLTKDYKVIAVAGTHGKTTTTSMLAWMLTELHQDPSYIVGGVVNNLGTNAHAGKGTWFVIEADEYDRMFLGLKPDIAIITNIEHDHPDIFPEPTDFELAFRDFTACVKENGVIIGCGDNPPTVRLLEDMAVKNVEILQYGVDPHRNTYWAEDVALKEKRTGYEFNFMKQQEYVTHVSLQIPE
ncbi:MAG: hypothetical protein J7L73_02895, partial [Anaerolineales bacterium]|nr:hypothetical protein [Anaerolineales bacterium]